MRRLHESGIVELSSTVFMAAVVALLFLIALAGCAESGQQAKQTLLTNTGTVETVATVLARETETVAQRTETAAPTTSVSTPTPGMTAFVTANVLNVRSGPGTHYAVVAKVKKGDVLTLLGRNEAGSWLKIDLPKHDEAWVSAHFVATTATLAALPAVQTTAKLAPTKPVVATKQVVTGGTVRIVRVLKDGKKGRNEPDEFVEIRNEGKDQNMTGWYLVSQRGNQVFHFPNGFTMKAGQTCRIYTNEVHPEWCGLSYGSPKAIWNNKKSDLALLYNSQGKMVSRWP